MIPASLRARLATVTLTFTLALCAAAQGERRSPLDGVSWGIVYDVPGTKDVLVKKNIPYHRVGERELCIDLYTPPRSKPVAPLPAVVFINAVGDHPGNPLKEWEIYRTWPRLVAAHGMGGISMDCDGERVQECLRALFAFLAREGSKHGVDGARLGLYAASANSSGTLELVMGESPPPGVRALALFYGWPEAERLRRDLPVLCITAEGDLPGSRELLGRLWPRVLESGAPWTMEIATGKPHAFDAFSDDDDSRRIIQRAIAFWKSHLEPVPQPPWEPSKEREIVAALYGHDEPRLLALIGAWIAEHPDQPEGYAARGTALARAYRGVEAKPDLERALALGSQDPGVHGCLGMILAHMNQYEAAVEHMQTAIAGHWYGSQLYGDLGLAQLMLGRNEEAVRSYEESIRLGLPPGANTAGIAHFNLACGYTRLGRVDDALAALEKSVSERFGTRATYEGDADLAPLREDERFAMLLDRLDQPAAR